MSRNLNRTTCHFCDGKVILDEAPRALLRSDAGEYFAEYSGMTVADAVCVECEAKYLAWVSEKGRPMHPFPREPYPESVGGRPFVDLSFRSTFNDEPGQADLPRLQVRKEVVRHLSPWPTCADCGGKMWEEVCIMCRRLATGPLGRRA